MRFSLVDNKIVRFIKEARAELRKVIWPSRKELRKLTLIVIGVSLATAIFLGLLDFLFSLGIGKIVR